MSSSSNVDGVRCVSLFRAPRGGSSEELGEMAAADKSGAFCKRTSWGDVDGGGP